MSHSTYSFGCKIKIIFLITYQIVQTLVKCRLLGLTVCQSTCLLVFTGIHNEKGLHIWDGNGYPLSYSQAKKFTQCMLCNFECFFCGLQIFSGSNFSKISFWNIMSPSRQNESRLGPKFVPYLGPNYLNRLSASNKK